MLFLTPSVRLSSFPFAFFFSERGKVMILTVLPAPTHGLGITVVTEGIGLGAVYVG